MSRIVQWLEAHQVRLYLLGIAVGAAVGLAFPQSAPVLEGAIEPVLMLLLYLLLFVGGEVLAVIESSPFLRAFLLLIVVPLACAALVQATARRHAAGRRLESLLGAAMVPLMVATLLAVVGSQITAVGSQLGSLARLVPLYAGFVVIALAVGAISARLARLDVPSTRAVMFSAVTRNSLVVLPLALALPASLALTPLAVVTQTLVELLAMVVLVRAVPALVPDRAA